MLFLLHLLHFLSIGEVCAVFVFYGLFFFTCKRPERKTRIHFQVPFTCRSYVHFTFKCVKRFRFETFLLFFREGFSILLYILVVVQAQAFFCFWFSSQ